MPVDDEASTGPPITKVCWAARKNSKEHRRISGRHRFASDVLLYMQRTGQM